MKTPLRSALDLRVTSILLASKAGGPPVDLFRVARTCRVVSVHLRDMIPRGGLEVVESGFRVYLRDAADGDVDLNVPEGTTLSVRQRFTLAHELAHTLFYEWSSDRPRPRAGTPPGPELERACDGLAAELVVPTELLRPRLRGREELTTTDILRLAEEFGVSAEMMLNRIAGAGCAAVNRAVILARRAGPKEAEVRALWFGAALLSFVLKPAHYQKVSGSDPALAASLEAVNGETWERRHRGRIIRFQKLEHPKAPNQFFVEAEAS